MTRPPKDTVTSCSEGVTVIGWSGPGTRTCLSVIPGQPPRRPVDSGWSWHDPAMPPRTPAVRGLLAVLAALVLGLSALSLTTLGQSASAADPPWGLIRPGTDQVE